MLTSLSEARAKTAERKKLLNKNISDSWRHWINRSLAFRGKTQLPDRPFSLKQCATHVWAQTGIVGPDGSAIDPERWLLELCAPLFRQPVRETSPWNPSPKGWHENPLDLDGIDVRSKQFLATFAWRSLRYTIIQAKGGTCRACGRNPRDNGVTINVDHIYPRRLYPQWALEPRNLQILCDECNHGKANGEALCWERRL